MENNPNIRDQRNKSRTFLIIGYIFLVAMALFWAVDSSIVYILFGISIYFLFLGIYTNSSGKNSQDTFKPSRQTPGSATSFGDELKSIFQKDLAFQTKSQKTFTNRTTSSQPNRSVFTLVIVAMFVIFFIFFIVSIFSSSGEWDDSVIYFQTAEQNYGNGNYDSAYLNYRKAWKINKEYAEAMVGYGNVLAIRKQSDSAMIMFDNALEINPEYKEASYSKAWAHYNLEKYNESIAVLSPLLQKWTEYYDAMLLMGDCYYALRQYDDAISWYGNAYENGGARSLELCHIMAYIYDTKGNYTQAIELYKEALSYDSTVVDIYKRLGELLPNEDGNYYRTQAIKLEQQ